MILSATEGKGFIVVKNDTQLPNMPGLRHPENEQRACLAIFHQLHCLVSMIPMLQAGYKSNNRLLT